MHPPDALPPVGPAEVTADALRRCLDRVVDHLTRATHGLEQLGVALGLTPQPTEHNMTKQNNEQVPA